MGADSNLAYSKLVEASQTLSAYALPDLAAEFTERVEAMVATADQLPDAEAQEELQGLTEQLGLYAIGQTDLFAIRGE